MPTTQFLREHRGKAKCKSTARAHGERAQRESIVSATAQSESTVREHGDSAW
jgi:hypothetical protein